MITVAVYLHQRAYGGPEEGGWWYDAYDPQLDDEFARFIQHYPDNDDGWEDAHRWCDHVQEWLDKEHNNMLPPVHSVNSDGVYAMHITKGYALTPLPTRRPHYE